MWGYQSVVSSGGLGDGEGWLLGCVLLGMVFIASGILLGVVQKVVSD